MANSLLGEKFNGLKREIIDRNFPDEQWPPLQENLMSLCLQALEGEDIKLAKEIADLHFEYYSKRGLTGTKKTIGKVVKILGGLKQNVSDFHLEPGGEIQKMTQKSGAFTAATNEQSS